MIHDLKIIIIYYCLSVNKILRMKMGWLTSLVLAVVGVLSFISSTQAQLQNGFYAKSCPNAGKIVLDFVHEHIHNASSLATTFIRMKIKQETNKSNKEMESKDIHKPYSMEAPSIEDNHTVNSPPQAVFFTSDTRQRTGDDSISTQQKE